MHLFFLCFFIFVSTSLIFLILLQPNKSLNNTLNLNSKNNIKVLNNFGTNSYIYNIIKIFSFLFLLISIILCNINSRKIDTDFFWKNDTKSIVQNQNVSDKKLLHSDIPL